MKIGVMVLADFERGPLGGPSHLEAPLAGRSILGRTLARAARIAGADARFVACRPELRSKLEAAAREAGVAGAFQWMELEAEPRPRWELIRAARLWNPDAWRGAPLGATWFDEFVEPLRLPALFRQAHPCDALLLLDGHQPLLDVAIADAMVAQQRTRAAEAAFTFTQAPPGLAGLLLTADAAAELIDSRSIAGLLFAYRPEAPQLDLLTKPMCLNIDGAVAQCLGRFTGDTRRSRDLLSAVIAALGEDAEARSIAAFCHSRQDLPGGLPREVELELTTRTPRPESRLDSAPLVPRPRHLADPAAVERIARELGAWDDSQVVLGGHGDPLQHPDFPAICRALRTGGVAALAVTTPLVDLPPEAEAALFEAPVDVVQVAIDAATPETYQRVHGADQLQRVLGNIERLLAGRRSRGAPRPLVIPSLVRCAETYADLEAFYDRWIRVAGSAMLAGFNEFCGRRPADGLLGLEPPVRRACRRLASRLVLLGDGMAAVCAQDVAGEAGVGRWAEAGSTIQSIWQGARLDSVRELHRSARWHESALCRSCREWFRP